MNQQIKIICAAYRKHYPPALEDEVWRLEKIAKDGKFHKKLADANINTVQDFLKLWFVNPQSLRQVKLERIRWSYLKW